MVAGPSADTVLITQLVSVCQGFSIHVYSGRHCGSCFICMNVIFIVPVDVLPQWMPGHLQTQCWSPKWLVFCQGFSIHMHSGGHCGSCFICMNVIFIVPVDVLPPWLSGHLQTQCWSPNWLVFCQGFSIRLYSGGPCGSCFYLYECDLHCACWCPAPVVVRPSADTVLITQLVSVLSGFQYPHALWRTLWFLFYLHECDLHCACWCPAPVVVRPSADTVLITQLVSVLSGFQYPHILWRTLWFQFYLYECVLHCACWCPAPVVARPSADTVLITQLDNALSSFQYLHVLWKTLWFLFYAYECDLYCACCCPAPMVVRPSADTVLINIVILGW